MKLSINVNAIRERSKNISLDRQAHTTTNSPFISTRNLSSYGFKDPEETESPLKLRLEPQTPTPGAVSPLPLELRRKFKNALTKKYSDFL